jgi:iron-sulfur cluster assembly protein
MLELAAGAVKEIKELVETGGLRFVGHAGEDGSFEFEPSLAEAPEEGDQVIEQDGARVYLDALAADKLDDMILEIEAHGDHVHFNFAPQDGGGEGSADDDA